MGYEPAIFLCILFCPCMLHPFDLCMMCSMMSLVTHVKLLCLIQVQLDRGSHVEYMHEAVSSEQLTYLLLLAFSVGFSIAGLPTSRMTNRD